MYERILLEMKIKGIKPNNYHAISCFLLHRVQFRVQFFVKPGKGIRSRTPKHRTPTGPSGVGSS